MSRHLTLNFLRLIFSGHVSPWELLRREHEHLSDLCKPCRVEWEVARDDPEDETWAPPLPIHREPLPELPEEPRHVSYQDLDRRLRLEARRSKQKRQARRHLKALRQAAPEDRAHRIESAVSRFRSRAFAELLIQESQRLAWSDPGEAENLASLVSLVVKRIPGAREQEWSHDLVLQGMGWQANALRVSGDLRAAERIFAELARLAPPSSALLHAELASLRADLRIAQSL